MMQIRDMLFGQSDRNYHIESEARVYLSKLWVDAQEDITKFKAGLEDWFNDMNERLEGGYKWLTQTILFVVGFVLAVSFNIDTIAVAYMG